MATCNKCGWVHFDVSAEYVRNHVSEFNEWYSGQTHEVQQMYMGPVRVEQYTQCFLCGGSYKNFRDSAEGDCPMGCTIQAILDRREDL